MFSFAFSVLVDLFEGITNCKHLSTYHACIRYDYGAGHGLLLRFQNEDEVLLRDGFPCLYCLATERPRHVLRSRTHDLRNSCAEVMADLLAWKVVRDTPGRTELERVWKAVTSAPEWGLTCISGDEREGNILAESNEGVTGGGVRRSHKRDFQTLHRALTTLSQAPADVEVLRYELPSRLECRWRHPRGHAVLMCEGIRWVHMELARTEAHRDTHVQQWLSVERRPPDLWRVVLWRRNLVHAICYADRVSLDVG